MITEFEDFCVYMYTVVDDVWQQISELFKRSGPQPVCSDSELIAMTLIGESRGWELETELLANWRQYPQLFPHVPSQSRYNRRRKQLMYGINAVRRVVLGLTDVTYDRDTAIDSLPVPVVEFHLVPGASREWASHGAAFGKVSSKKQRLLILIHYRLQVASARDIGRRDPRLRASTRQGH